MREAWSHIQALESRERFQSGVSVLCYISFQHCVLMSSLTRKDRNSCYRINYNQTAVAFNSQNHFPHIVLTSKRKTPNTPPPRLEPPTPQKHKKQTHSHSGYPGLCTRIGSSLYREAGVVLVSLAPAWHPQVSGGITCGWYLIPGRLRHRLDS